MKKDVSLKVDGLTIRGQLHLPENSDKFPSPAICICHGIPSGQASPVNKGYPQLAERLCNEGFVTLFFNFRGTGASEGNFDILGWTRDLKSAINYLWASPAVDRNKLSLLGFSAGAAVSIYVAAQDHRISSVAACACPAEINLNPDKDNPLSVINYFRNLGIIRDKGFPPSMEDWFGGFKMVSPVDSIASIAPRPLLLVHSQHDEIVPVSHAHRLYGRALEPKKLVIIDGTDHRLRLNEEAIKIVSDWLKSQSQRALDNSDCHCEAQS